MVDAIRNDAQEPCDQKEGQAVLMVALPALNEDRTIGEVIGRIPHNLPGIDSVEIFVVDDGSTDGTVAMAKAAGARVISHGRNMGVGAAFGTILEQARRTHPDYLVTIDADGQFAPESIPDLLRPIMSGEADFATASRFKDVALTPVM